MEACIDVMQDVLGALARGEALQPLRTVLRLPRERGAFAVMPAQVSRPDAFGVKVITVVPGNEGTRYDSHQGAVLLFEPGHGTLVAIMDASAMTAIRTAAVSAVATRLLARPEAGDLALLGTGVQARTHLEAMRAVRTIRRVRAWSRQESHRREFAEWAGHRYGIEVEIPVTAREAVLGADLICTVTASRTPVVEGAWLSPGTHINAVGASLPDTRELDTAAVVRARLFVDRRESALNEAGDFLIPRAEGAISDEHLRGELGDLLVGRLIGREDETQVTLFKSLGLAVEDVAAAHVVHQEAERRNVGTLVELGGLREQAD
jgi:ornithine cyclodeaminase